MANSQETKSWERSVAWALGNVDEALFAVGSVVLGMKHKTPYISDRAELDRLEQTASSTTALHDFFVEPPVPTPEIKPTKLSRTAWPGGVAAQDYQAFKLEYPSAIRTDYGSNNRVHAVYLQRVGQENGPVIIYLHGWMEFEPSLSLRLPLGWAGPLGLNVLALHLPFHFERAPQNTVSGELSITGNLPLAVTGLRQAVSDVRQALYWLKRADPGRPVGITGKSLGGLVGAVSLAAESDFQAGLLVVPATSTRASIWQSGHTRLIRRDLTTQGLDEEATARLLEIVRPGRYQPLIDPARILVLKARADRVCFPDDTDLFATQWRTRLIELPTGHLTATFDPRGRRAAQQHLRHYLL